METPDAIAQLLGLTTERLMGHLRTPLHQPRPNPLSGWPGHKDIERLLSICDGFSLFYPDPPFRIFGSGDYEYLDSAIGCDARRFGLLPVFGDCPHLTSVIVSSGAVVATDWEVCGEPQSGWLRPIAGSFGEYVRTVIEVREAYGDPKDAWPSDWWDPYASSGYRYDLENR